MTATITRHEGAVHSDISVIDGVMSIDLIYVPFRLRGHGYGTAELVRLLAVADENAWKVILDADSAFGVDVTSLVRWYSKHGFRVRERLSGGRVSMERASVPRQAA